MTETVEQPQVLPAPMPTKSPDQLFVEWLQANNFVSVAVAVAPTGDTINARAYIPAGWQIVVGVVEAKRNGV